MILFQFFHQIRLRLSALQKTSTFLFSPQTYSADKQVPDSSSTATALFGGAKTNYNTVGVDSYVRSGNCSDTLDELHHVESILHWAQEADLATGFVTTSRVVHGTPAPLYSHTADQSWECEATMSSEARGLGCKDIARQLFENAPGRHLNVIMGGGRQSLVSGVQGTAKDPVDNLGCRSVDGRNLIADWEADKRRRDLSYRLVNKTDDLENLEGADYVLGIFANGHMPYDDQRDKSSGGQPSLVEMTEAALQVLQRDDRGFVLVVEGGLIDLAHRSGWTNRALTETVEFDKAIAATVERMRPHWDETLIIVASDHAQTLSINGFEIQRGTDVSVWAMGPMAHLFHRLHEQSYVAHVIAYAARIGRFKDTVVATALLDILGFT
jgi:alkaline phosphatase